MSTTSIPGVDRDALVDAIIKQGLPLSEWGALSAADVVLAHIAERHECTCDREHADEWVEVEEATWYGLSHGARLREERAMGSIDASRYFVHRDDLPDDQVDAKAALAGLAQRARKAKESRIDAQDFEGAKPWREVEAGLLAVLATLPDPDPDADPDPRALITSELGAAKADTFLGLLDEHGWTVTRKGER